MLRLLLPLAAAAALTACDEAAMARMNGEPAPAVSPFPEPQPVALVNEAGEPIEQPGLFTITAIARATPPSFTETLTDATLRGTRESFVLADGGTFTGRNRNGAETAGFWEVRENRLCRTFTLPAERTTCAGLTIVGDRVTLDEGGANIYSYTLNEVPVVVTAETEDGAADAGAETDT